MIHAVRLVVECMVFLWRGLLILGRMPMPLLLEGKAKVGNRLRWSRARVRSRAKNRPVVVVKPWRSLFRLNGGWNRRSSVLALWFVRVRRCLPPAKLGVPFITFLSFLLSRNIFFASF